MKQMSIRDIVFKLVGDISSIGSTHVDKERYENLKVFCGLLEDMVWELGKESQKTKRYEHSMIQSGNLSKLALKDLKSMIEEFLEEQ